MHYQQIAFDPGIIGFVKAHRHHSGCALVMSTWEKGDIDWIGIHWVRRLIYNAVRVSGEEFPVVNEKTIKAAERCYDFFLAHGPPPEAFSDNQRLRVYDWEEDHIFPGHDTPMTWDGCQYFLSQIWKQIGKGPEPLLVNNRKFKKAISLGGVIHLPPNTDYWSRPVILHEIAHELQPRAAHGPIFVSVYMDLAVRCLGLDRCALERTASQYNVNYKDKTT